MQILKFGGSSVGTPARVKHVMGIVNRAHHTHKDVIVVFSAFQGVTDQLIAVSTMAAAGDKKYQAALRTLKKRHLQAVSELVGSRRTKAAEESVRARLADLTDVLHGIFFTRELTVRMLDYVMGFGELLSSTIIVEALRSQAVRCDFVDSRTLIKADEPFGNGHVRYDQTYQNIRSHFKTKKGLHIVPGFIASTQHNDTITLGRGGSDFTASLYGAALHADEIEIWTDVDGVMTADPRKVEKAFSIPSMTYEEAMEMSHFGAKVIHPPTMQPALNRKIPLRIRNTFNPEFPGTVIGKTATNGKHSIKGISSIDDISLLRIQGSGMFGVAGIGRRIFGALSAQGINVFLTTQASSEYSLCIAVNPAEAQRAKEAIESEMRHEIRDRLIEGVLLEANLSVVAIVGENMRRTTGIAARMFSALGKNGINVVAIAQGSSELNISAVVGRDDEAKTLNALHDAFFLSGTKSVNIFLVGTGLIGGALLQQIGQQRHVLRETHNLDIRVHALANRRMMLFDTHGVHPQTLKARLEQSRQPMDLDQFVRRMKEMNLPNSVFVDCTSSNQIVSKYEEILTSSISIVTPNKKANAGTYKLYSTLRQTALKHNARFLYEANVGAGLPIINTINDLVAGGDRILKIEGVFSGTLSFIFNSFVEGRKFSEIVAEAKERGYTEPDPRDDLSGADAGRKLLIVARESGHKVEPSAVKVQSLLPPALAKKKTVSDFLQALPSLDDKFETMRLSAARSGKVLRYMAVWDGASAEVGLRSVPLSHPAAGLTGSDAMIVLTTENCKEQPVVIKGPGAGAGVTATAVFADIIRTGFFTD